MSEPQFHVADDPAADVAELLADQARRGGSIVLTGGSSPGRAYELAAELEPDWSRAQAWWGDERCVPPEDERSNFGLAKRSLFDRLAAPPELHRIQGELPPAEAAARYEQELAGTTARPAAARARPRRTRRLALPRLAPARRARTARHERPGWARAVRRACQLDAPGAARGAAAGRAGGRSGQGRRGRARLPRAGQRGGPCQPAAARGGAARCLPGRGCGYGSSGELSSGAKPRRAASTWSTITVSATGTSSR